MLYNLYTPDETVEDLEDCCVGELLTHVEALESKAYLEQVVGIRVYLLPVGL